MLGSRFESAAKRERERVCESEDLNQRTSHHKRGGYPYCSDDLLWFLIPGCEVSVLTDPLTFRFVRDGTIMTLLTGASIAYRIDVDRERVELRIENRTL